MYRLFGVAQRSAGRGRSRLSFSAADPALSFIDNDRERTISLGNGERHFFDQVIWSHGAVTELQAALADVKTLRGMLPICSSCKKIRDQRGNWHHIEDYLHAHSDAQFSHGLCDECFERMYPDLLDSGDP